MSSRSWAGSAQLASRSMPWTQTELTLLASGSFAGFQLGTARVGNLDMHRLVADGFFENGNISIVGPIRHGKDTLAKCIASSAIGMQAGVDLDGNPIEQTRQWAYDLKREQRRGEWSMVTGTARELPVEFAKGGSFNLLSSYPGVTADDHVRHLLLQVRSQVGIEPSTYQLMGLQMVVNNLYQRGIELDVDLVTHRLHRIDRQELKGFLDTDVTALREKYEAARQSDNQQAAEYLAPLYEDAFSPELASNDQLFGEFRRQVVEFASQLTVLKTASEYNGLWGGTDNYFDLMGRRFCQWDLNGMSAMAAGSMELALNAAQDVLAREEAGDSLLAPHYVWFDEQGSHLNDPAHAALRAERSRVKRASKSIEVSMYQNLDDPLEIGDAGSALRRYGEVIFNNTGAIFTGRLPRNDKILNLLTSRGATDAEAWACTQLTQGQWGLLACGTGRPMEYFQHYVLPSQAKMIDTESMARIAGARHNVGDSDVYKERRLILNDLENNEPEQEEEPVA